MLNHHEKRDPAVAVSFFLTKKSTEGDAKRMAAADKANKARKDYFDLHERLCQAFAARKSAYIGCHVCGSKLSRMHLCTPTAISTVCPLCKTSLISKTDQARLAKAEEKQRAAERAYQDSRKPKPGECLGWIVGGWAAS